MAEFTGTYPDELRDLMVGLNELREAEPDYRTAHDYFTGDVPEHFASAKLARRIEEQGSSYRVNLAKKAVTSVTNRAEIGSVVAVGKNGRGNNAATKILNEQVWNANELGLEVPEWLERVGEFGDGYIFVWPSEVTESGQALAVDINFSTPMTTRAIYDPENPRKIAYTVKAWETGAGERKQLRVNLYYPDRIEKWVTLEGTDGQTPEHWTQYEVEGEAWPLPNPYGQIVFHIRTGRPYGTPLHTEFYGPQDAINKLIVSMMTTIDFHIIPQRAALLDGTSDEDDDDFDEDFGHDDLASTLTDEQRKRAEGMSKLKTGPGELWVLKNTRSLVQLPAADPKNFLTPTEFFLRIGAQVTDMPLHFFDPGGDQPSGDSRRQSEGTLTKKIDRFCDYVEPALAGAMHKALDMLGVKNIVAVDIRWTPSEIVDDSEGWTTAKAKIDAGVPVRQVLIEAGYEPEQVDAWLNTTTESDLRRRVELVGQLAQAVRNLGTGAGMGVIDPALISAVMEGFLPADGAAA